MKNLKNKFLPFVTIFAILTTMFTVLLAPVAVEAASLATYDNLYAAVQGETNATAAYTAFAEKAIEEGYPVIGRLFVATSEAEAKHAEDEWNILVSMGAKNRPVAAAPAVGTTADNLQAAFGGETYEYQTMYPGFLATAQAENQAGAERIFNLAGQAEKVHAGNYADVLANLANYSYIEATYGTIYRCPVCGEIVTGRPGRCPICGAGGEIFVMYNETYFNLYASVQGETNASASYIAFSAVAKAEGNFVVARLFAATSDAEAKHAADEWEILQSMGATKRPVVGVLNVGTTADNLQAAFNGETYEYQTMYPNFKAAADAEGMVAASRIFNMAGQAEEVHAGNYADVLANLSNLSYVNAKYETVYRCPVCGEVVNARPDRCPICGASGASFVAYSGPVSVSASASVAKLQGNKNALTISVDEIYLDGSEANIQVTILIDNNAAGAYAVGDYCVYVDTKGNDQIRSCYFIW